MHFEFETANEVFSALGKELLALEPSSSPRGLLTRELLNANITINNPLLYTTARTRRAYAFGEFCWYLSGQNTLQGIDPYAPMWKNIADGNGKLNSNYGYYLFQEKQFSNILNLLINDMDSRKAVIQIFQPHSIQSKDTTCTLTIQYLIRPRMVNGVREYALHSIVNMRSQDVTRGFPYDVMMFSLFQQILCTLINRVWKNNFSDTGRPLAIGQYHHNVGSFHVYETDVEDLTKAVEQTDIKQIPVFDELAYSEVSDALTMEFELRTLGYKAKELNYNFKSAFWQEGVAALQKKFIKEPVQENATN